MLVGEMVQRCQTLTQQLGGTMSIHARSSVGSGYLRITDVDTHAQAQWFAAIPEALWIATNATDLPSYWHPPAAGLDIMHHIRHEFDPMQRLNPQRFVV